MSDWKMHSLVGTVVGLLVYSLLINIFKLEWTTLHFFVYLPIIFLYSILPDFDIGTSVARKLIFIFLTIATAAAITMFFIFKNVLYLFLSFIPLIIIILSQFLKHRGWMHLVVTGALLSILLVLLDWYAALFGFISYTTHLVLDKK